MTPLVLIVGFLGAGKTTLLRRLVPLLIEKKISPSIVLNDYQNASVDAELFRDLAAQVTPISGSCVCCGSRQELLDALDAFVPRPGSILLVETNGTTDATELVTLLASDPNLRHFSLPVQVSVIDAKRWQKRFWHNGLEAEQVRTANHLVLTREEDLSDPRRAEILRSLGELAPDSPLTTPETLSGILSELVSSIAPHDSRTVHHHEEHHHEEHHHEHGHHEHEHPHGPEEDHQHDAGKFHFAAAEIFLPAVVERKAMERVLKSLPDEVLRAKGLVRLSDDIERWTIFQKVQQFDEVQWFPLDGEPHTPEALAIFVGSKLPSDLEARFAEVSAG